jgi:hypothetical protein
VEIPTLYFGASIGAGATGSGKEKLFSLH